MRIADLPSSPFSVCKIMYASNSERTKILETTLDKWATIVADMKLKDEHLYFPAYRAFHIIKFLALICKHTGFSEEKEWRVIYDSDLDPNGVLKQYLSYHIGDRGVEPKLKYKIGYLAGVTAEDMSLERLLDRIILGPSVSSPLAVKSVERMLESVGKPHLKAMIKASGIPLRPLGGTSF
jgi:hypothetical protein